MSKKEPSLRSMFVTMKYISLIFVSFLLFACSSGGEDLMGRWRFSDLAYRAQYEITKGEDGLDCIVVSYDDGTMKHVHTESNTKYLFKGIKQDGDVFVDGVSGATKDKESQKPAMFTVELIHEDTLKVISKILNETKTEHWVRVQ